jgi:fluoride exporter
LSIVTIFAIGIGGFVGSVIRAYLSGIINKTFLHDIPYGTLGVNLIGSLIIGILFAIFSTMEIPSNIKSFLTTGILGGLTTFSTFAIESFWLLKTNYILGILNILLNVIGSITFAGVGFKIFENLLSK